MKSNLLFVVGLFAALLISWLGIVIGSNVQLGSLPPYYDDNDGSTHPEWLAGVAAQGQLVYRQLGCIACHTQQVRRPSFGSDQARGWGDRQSVARDYIYQPFPQLGLARIGPDLTNVGDRKPPYDPDDFLTLLYSGAKGMPSYRFLFEMRRIGADAQPSDNALKLTGDLRPAAGWEIVPTKRAESLVGYLVNLKTTYTYPEAVPFVAAKPEGEAAKAAPAPTPAAPPPSGAAPAPTPPPGIISAPAAAQAASAAPAPAVAAPATPAASGAGATPTPSSAPATTTPAPSTAPTPEASAGPASSGTTPTPTTSQPAATTPAPAVPAPSTPPPAGAEPTPSPTGTK